MNRYPWLHYVLQEKAGGDGGDGSGAGDEDGEKKKKSKTEIEVKLAPEVEKSFASAMERAGEAEKFARSLFSENHQLREDKRKLAEEVKTGTVDPAVAKELAAYKELGELEELKKANGEYARLKNKVEKQERAAKSGKAAAVLGYNEKVFAMFVENEGLKVVMKKVKGEEEGDEKVLKVFYETKGEDDAGNETTVHESLSDYVEEEHPELLASLTLSTEDRSENNGRTNRGHLYPAQRLNREKTKGSQTKGAATGFLSRKYTSKATKE
ncbi:MAG: hypothetical protein GY938_12910 [Ketobacter sp.]|nr:hypothetical protein [Ketobacter sp.]